MSLNLSLPSRETFAGKVAFAIGTGRCGTHLLSQLLAHEPAVAASHERNRLNETFHRYCQWYSLPVDHGGFLHTKAAEVEQDLQSNSFSFESSGYLSLSVLQLYDCFDARFVLMVRRPEAVVNSYWSKGWYETNPIYLDETQALGFNWYQASHPHYIFSRLAPTGDERSSWLQLTRVGKLAWFWNELNTAVINRFTAIPTTHYKIVKLEELSFQTYQEILSFLGWPSQMSEEKYRQISQTRPGQRERKYTISDWSVQEVAEFEAQAEPMAAYFGYPHRYQELSRPAFQGQEKPATFNHNLKRTRARVKQWAYHKLFPEG
jgi:hypothetical protein